MEASCLLQEFSILVQVIVSPLDIQTGYGILPKRRVIHITDLCAILGGTDPAPSSGRMTAVAIVPCIAAYVLSYFMFL